MDKSKGYICLYRSIQDHWLWNGNVEPFDRRSAWTDLLLLANHTDHKFMQGNEIIEAKAGTVITSILKLGSRWGWERKKVRKYLNLLEKDQMITTTRTTQGTTITIINYGDYNNMGTTKGTTKGQRRDNKGDTNNNDNNEKKDNNVQNPNKEQIDQLFDELWKSYPKKRGKGQVSDVKKRKLYKIGYEEMKRALDRYKEEHKEEIKNGNLQYVKDGSTFFNSGYVDYLDENYEPIKTTNVMTSWDEQTITNMSFL